MAQTYPNSGEVRRSQIEFTDQSYKIRIWVMVALIGSVVVHAGLYVAAMRFGWGSGLGTKDLQILKEKRVTISKELLQNKEIIQKPVELTPPAVAPLDLDQYDLQQVLPDQDIDLTPQVDDIKAFVRNSGPDPTSASAFQPVESEKAPTGQDMSDALTSLKKSALRERMSDKQVAIDQPAGEERELGVMDDLLSQVKEITAQGEGEGEKVPGFSTLDDIFGAGGAMSDHSGPILMPTDLLFAYNSAELGEGARLSMMKLGFIIQRNPDKKFLIEGHTDDIGTDEYNDVLSAKRAEAVKAWLVESLLISPDLIETEGVGERDLLVSGGTVEQQGKNRRVEIKVR